MLRILQQLSQYDLLASDYISFLRFSFYLKDFKSQLSVIDRITQQEVMKQL